MSGGSALAPRLGLDAVRGMAAGLLARQGDLPIASLMEFAQLCRQAGALEEARALLDRLLATPGSSLVAQELRDALEGRRTESKRAAAQPAPFLRRQAFIGAPLHDHLLDGLRDRLPTFKPAEVRAGSGHEGDYTTAQRSSFVLYDLGNLAGLFLGPMQILLDEAYTVFQVPPESVSHIELQATCHGDGAYFTAHSDLDLEQTSQRTLSFVYYLHSVPKAFSGGDLILFDTNADTKTYSRSAYSRVPPTDNTLVVFPSSTVHEVQLVKLKGAAAADGRLTINGWVRCR